MDIETANSKMKYSPEEGIWRDKHWIKHYLHESCSVCGNPFVGKKYNTRCSRKCFLVEDNPMFKESNKKAMSKRFSGENNHMKRPEVVAKISGENCWIYGNGGHLKGEGNPAWAGGVSRLPYPFEFDFDLKSVIRERDGFMCRECGATKEKLTCHHIDYDKSNLSHMNLITLCFTCNTRANYNRNDWQDKYSRMIAIQT